VQNQRNAGHHEHAKEEGYHETLHQYPRYQRRHALRAAALASLLGETTWSVAEPSPPLIPEERRTHSFKRDSDDAPVQ